MSVTGVELVWSEGIGGRPFDVMIQEVIDYLIDQGKIVRDVKITGAPDYLLALITYGK